jgi:cardiolipin synthase
MPSAKLKPPSAAYIKDNKVTLATAGKDYFNLLIDTINRAADTIHLQVYIYDEDETGKLVAGALIAAAKRNVKVYVMPDAYASHNLSKHFIRQFKEAGIQFRFFQPFFKSKHFYIGRRLHHKLLVADGKYCIVGGINIGDRYNHTAEHTAWLDFALYAEGPVAQQVCILACKTWQGFPAKIKPAPCGCGQTHFYNSHAKTCEVRMRRNDWVRYKNEISKTYREMFKTASSHITILCSYFMPGSSMKKYIMGAVKRNVKIKVIMAGRSDVPLAKNAERFMYDWLLRNGVEIYEYQDNILHGKLAVCDGKWMTLGSYNINNISAYASIELNLDVNDAAFANYAENTLYNIMERSCVCITREVRVKSKNIIRQFIDWCSYEFIRVMFFLFTFYFRQSRF